MTRGAEVPRGWDMAVETVRRLGERLQGLCDKSGLCLSVQLLEPLERTHRGGEERKRETTENSSIETFQNNTTRSSNEYDIEFKDPLFRSGSQWNYNDATANVGVLALWRNGVNGSSAGEPISIGVIDDGAYIEHPDLSTSHVRKKKPSMASQIAHIGCRQ